MKRLRPPLGAAAAVLRRARNGHAILWPDRLRCCLAPPDDVVSAGGPPALVSPPRARLRLLPRGREPREGRLLLLLPPGAGRSRNRRRASAGIPLRLLAASLVPARRHCPAGRQRRGGPRPRRALGVAAIAG